jgi:hypothetical protein
MNLIGKAVGAVLCALMFLTGCLTPPQAAAEVVLKLWPTRLELVVPEGGTVTRVVNLENAGDEPVCLNVYAMDFTVGQDGAYLFSEPGHQTYSCTQWISIDQSDLSLAPGETRSVELTVIVPDRVEPGGHYAAVFFEQSGDTGEGTSVVVGARMACLVYVTVPGVTDADITTAVEILHLTVPGWIKGGPVRAGAVVRNSGNVHLTVAAKAYVADLRGTHIGDVDLGQVIILPGGERLFEGTWDDLPLFGRFRATVVIGYHDEHGRLVNKEASADFQVVPWKVIMAVGLPLCILGLAILIVARRFRFRLKMERKK